jgi:hypothetical protein
MNPDKTFEHDSVSSVPQDAMPGSAEDTLRLIASLPAPKGLEDRIHAGLRSSLQSASRPARILEWPTALRSGGSWLHGAAMRSAAAAAIVCVVAGGGWGIYSHVQQSQPSRSIALPPHMAAPGGFSSGGAIRTPQTVNGPVLTHPQTASEPPATSPVAPIVTTKKQPSSKGAARKATAVPAAAPDSKNLKEKKPEVVNP